MSPTMMRSRLICISWFAFFASQTILQRIDAFVPLIQTKMLMQRQSLDSFCKHESLIKAHFNDGSEKLAQQSKISVVASYDDFFKVLAEDERLTIIK